MKDRKKTPLQDYLNNSDAARVGLLFLVLSIVTIILYPNLIITRHPYELGDIAGSDLKAPRDFFVEDRAATTARRREAMEQVRTVYDHNQAMLAEIEERVIAAFDAMQPKAPEIKAEQPPDQAKTDQQPAKKTTEKPVTSEKKQPVPDPRAVFEEILGIPVTENIFKQLKRAEFSQEISQTIVKVVRQVLENGVVANKEVLLNEKDRGILLRNLHDGEEREIHNLRKYYGPDQYKEMVRVIARPLTGAFSPALTSVLVDIAQRLIEPNITLNRSETEKRKREAAQAVKPVPYKIKEGEMLLREGDRVTDEKLAKIKALNAEKEKEKLYERSFGAIGIILCLLVIKYYIHLNPAHRRSTNHNKDLLFISTILILFFFIPKVSAVLFEALSRGAAMPIDPESLSYGIPLAASAMVVCLFMGMEIAIPFALVMSISTAIIFQNRFEIFIYFLLSATMGAFWMKNCRKRKVFIQAGVKLGLLNAALITAVDIYTGDMGGFKIVWDWAFAFLGGIMSGIITAGIVPLLEMSFGYTTDITLLELANLEQPILRRLMLEAPGTYHHSVVVGSMVEAAAAEIGANPVLAKVCGYYHDIGKIKKPLYFVENQTDGKNRHDKLAPSMSSLILISHVKDGVEIAKQNKLGQEIIDAIRQHHGTSLIRFFYEKAKKIKGEENVNIDNFRYPGPRPQTREAGLVMLADVVEAASRTLENPTPSRIQGNVQKLINAIFTDGQLDNCELTLADLHKIAKSFNKILNGIHHHRIEYAEASAGAGAKTTTNSSQGGKKRERKDKNGRADNQPAKQGKDQSGKPADNGAGRIRRLGVS